MSSSTAKFVPTLGGRVWRLQRQGAQTLNNAIKSATDASGSINGSSTSFMQRSSASYSTSSSSSSAWGQNQSQGWKSNGSSSSWSQRN